MKFPWTGKHNNYHSNLKIMTGSNPYIVLPETLRFPVTFPLGSQLDVALKIIQTTNFSEYYTGLSAAKLRNCSFSHHYLPSGCLPSDALAEVSKEICRSKSKSLIITLNVVSYREEWHDFLSRQVEKIADIGAQAVVISNLGLIHVVREVAPHMRIHISSVAGVINSKALSFFMEQGIDRIILPRSMRAREVVMLARQFPGLEIEAFIMGGGCAFSEHSCNMPHFIFEREKKLLNLGLDAMYLCPHRGGCQSPSLVTFKNSRRTELHLLHPGFMSCGICYTPYFLKAGVHTVKVTGRTQAAGKLEGQAQMIEILMRDMYRVRRDSFDIERCKREKSECLYEKENISELVS